MTLSEKIALMSEDEKKSLSCALMEKSSIDEVIAELAAMDVQTTRDEIESLIGNVANSISPADIKPVEMDDSELDNVSGGTEWYTQYMWYDSKQIEYIFKVGDIVEVASGWGFGTTVRCRITKLGVAQIVSGSYSGPPLYSDTYYCEEVEYHWYFSNGWYCRDCIEKARSFA